MRLEILSVLLLMMWSLAGLVLVPLYWFYLRRKPNLVRQLGSVNKAKSQQAFEQLLDTGEKAVPFFLQALATPTKALNPWLDIW